MVDGTATKLPERLVDLANERGSVGLGGLRGLTITLVIVAVLLFEGGAIVANFYQLDDLSGRAATAAAAAWRQTPASRPVLNAVDGVVNGAAQVERVEISQAEATVAVSLRRAPSVLVLDRVPALRARLTPTVTRQAALNPEGL